MLYVCVTVCFCQFVEKQKLYVNYCDYMNESSEVAALSSSTHSTFSFMLYHPCHTGPIISAKKSFR